MFYTVQPGDTLYRIALRFGTTAQSIMVLNNLQSPALYVGQVLKIPLYSEAVVNVDRANVRNGPGTNYTVVGQMVRGAKLPVTGGDSRWYRVRLHNGRQAFISSSVSTLNAYDGSKPITGIIGFYTLQEGPTLPGSFNSYVNNINEMTEAGLFMWRISAANPTTIEKFGQFTDQDVNTLVSIAHRNNLLIAPIVHNLLYRPGGTTLAKNVVRELVSVPQNRQAFASSIVNLIQTYNFDGVIIDIEDAYAEDKDRLSLLYADISRALKPLNYLFGAAIPSKVSDQPISAFSAPFDYAAIGRAVDQFIAMLYNEHGWPGSGPGPVVSIGWMERVLRYAMTRMPKEKIYGAVSVFGFDFNVTTGTNTYVTYSMAIDLSRRYNQAVIFDQPTQTPMFRYTDAQGNRHEVWFENSRSIKAKIDLAWRLGIGGIALWRLGMEDPDIWRMLREEVVVKRI